MQSEETARITVTCKAGTVTLSYFLSEGKDIAVKAATLQRRFFSEVATRDLLNQQVASYLSDVASNPLASSSDSFDGTIRSGIIFIALTLFLARPESSADTINALTLGQNIHFSIDQENASVRFDPGSQKKTITFRLSSASTEQSVH